MMVSRASDDGWGAHLIERDRVPQLVQMACVIALNFQTIAAANDWWRHLSAIRK